MSVLFEVLVRVRLGGGSWQPTSRIAGSPGRAALPGCGGSPTGVLLGQAEDQTAGLVVDGRSSRRPVQRRPLPGHELPMPPEERLRAEEERVPCFPRQQPARCGQERPVRGPVHGTLHLSPQDGDLVAQDRDLEFGLGWGPLIGTEQREDPAKER